jgi:GH25 family lysozyme M1 (1,4-beta-N-acetylmuramidase)
MRYVSRIALASATALALFAGLFVGVAAPAFATGSDGSGTDSSPSLAQMNAAHNHSMGSTIPRETAVAPSPRMAPRSLVATSNAVPSGVPGLDVSSWQQSVDWKDVWNKGARFAYIKATESTGYRSSTFSSQYTDSYNVGMIRGAYHFAVPSDSSGAVQANFFVNNGGGWKADGRTLPPMLDIEYNPYGATCYGLSTQQMIQWIADFSNTVLSRTGRTPTIYTTTDWWTKCTGNSTGFANNPLFIARYPNNIADGAGTLPASWTRYTMWQYTSAGIYPGDSDVFNGSLSTLQSFARGTTGSTVTNPLDMPIFGVGDLNGDKKPDIIARRPDGTLWFYPGTGSVGGTSEGYGAAVKIGAGWNIYDAIVGVGDFNGDKRNDLIARKPDGTLWFYPGTGSVASTGAAFGAVVKIGNSGWGAYTQLIPSGDFNGDGKPDLLARRLDGTLWYYEGTGVVNASNDGYLAAQKIGDGSWNNFNQVLGIGDLNRDGKPDLIGVLPDDKLLYYQGTGGGGGGYYLPAIAINSSGLTASDLLLAPGDMNSDGFPDLMARSLDGTLKFIAGTRTPQEGYKPALKIGNGGWNAYTAVVDTGDFNGDASADLLARRADGSLWYYNGTGKTTGASAWYTPALKVGNGGWNAYTSIIGTRDFNGDGTNDLIAVRSDGTLWFYAGTGKPSSTSEGYKPALKIGNGGWNAYSHIIAGDFNGDGKPDLLATNTNGTLWFYAGTQTSTGVNAWYTKAAKVGNGGWSAYDKLISTGDLNKDGKPDFLATRPDGTLWFYAGTGKASSTSGGYAPAVRIGSGWNAYSSIVGVGDWNGDSIADLLGVRNDGTLWFYADTGSTGGPEAGFYTATLIGHGWNIYG